MKRLIRWLYWKFGHEGDPWQAKLMLWHLGRVVTVAPSSSVGTLVLAQIEENLNKDGIAALSNIKLNKVAEVTIEDLTAKPPRFDSF